MMRLRSADFNKFKRPWMDLEHLFVTSTQCTHIMCRSIVYYGGVIVQAKNKNKWNIDI